MNDRCPSAFMDPGDGAKRMFAGGGFSSGYWVWILIGRGIVPVLGSLLSGQTKGLPPCLSCSNFLSRL